MIYYSVAHYYDIPDTILSNIKYDNIKQHC